MEAQLHSPDLYTIGWIAPLSIERAAATALLDERHKAPEEFNQPESDTNSYAWGKIGEHNIVIASLPAGVIGTISAATTASNLVSSLPHIRIGLLVGIGGGIPRLDQGRDIRLGDVVISQPDGSTGGVIQYDLGKAGSNGTWERRGSLNMPPLVLLHALASLKSEHEIAPSKVPGLLRTMWTANPRMAAPNINAPGYIHQTTEHDKLFHSSYNHVGGPTCDRCDESYLVERRARETTDPIFHYGIIASGNTLVKEALTRDEVAESAGENCLCFEMEAAGLMNHFPCIVIRGISDYADSHKNDRWQRYAAATAAAYAKELLSFIPARNLEATKRAADVMISITKDLARIQSDTSNTKQAVQSMRTDVLNLDRQSALSRLPIAVGASFDSHAEENNPTCLPGTRLTLINEIMSWVQDPLSKSIFWLNGMAGTGKSTLSRTLARSLAMNNQLGASFFFKRSEGDRSTSSRLFTTIAAQLGARNPSLASHIKWAIEDDSTISDKGLRIQFEKLILEPLVAFSTSTGKVETIVLVIDAWDECEVEDRQAKLILHLFSQARSQGLKVFLTSRPELSIRLGFRQIEGEYQDLVLHELGQDVVEGDLFSFFSHELTTIRLNYNASLPNGEKLPEGWPGKSSIDRLVSMASPLFIQAATICRLLGDRRHGDPNELLQDVLCYEKTNQETQLDATYLPVLSRLFTGLSARRRKQGLERFKLIVGSIIISARPLSTTSLSKLLSLPLNIIDCQLSLLHSVLSVPQSADAPVTIFHLSFRDFLVDAERHEGDDFWIDETTTHAKMATGCINVMRSFLKEDMCGLRSWKGEASNIERGAIGSCMPEEVKYACLHWSSHVEEAKGNTSADDVLAFLNVHFLHWAEALALTMRTVEAITAMQRLLDVFGWNTRLSDFLVDAVQILKANQSILDKAPLQLYSSVLQFAPQNSVVRKQFIIVLPRWITLRLRTESNWGPLKQVLECEARITCVALSHDSRLVAAHLANGFIHIWRIDTGECVNTFEVKDVEGVQYMAFSHNSEVLALGDSRTAGIRLWSTITNDCLRKLEPYLPDGYYGKNHAKVKPFKGCWFAFSDDACLLAFFVFQLGTDRFRAVIQCYSDLGEYIWKSTLMECNDELGWEYETILDVSVAFSGDLTMTAARMGRTVTVWRNINHYHPEKVFESPGTNNPISIALSHDGALLFMASPNGFSVWSTDNTDDSRPRFWEVRDYNWLSGPLTISDDSTFLVCGGVDYVYLWHKDKGEGIQNVVRQSSDIAVLSHDSSIIISGSGDKCLYVWGKNTFEPNQRQLADDSYQVDIHPTMAQMMELSPNSKQIAFALLYGSEIQLWATDTGQHIRTLKASQGRLDQFAFSRNSELLAARSVSSGDIWVWSTKTGIPIQVFKNWGVLAGPMSFSIDSTLLALVCNEGVATYCINTGRQVQSLIDAEGRDEREKHSSQDPQSCACFAMFSLDSTLMVAVFCYERICLWRLDTRIRIRTLPCYLDETTPMPVAISHDSQLMACIVGGKRVQLSSILARQDVGTFEISGLATVNSVAFLSGSSLLAVITLAGTVKIWSFAGRCCILNTRSDMETRHLGF
ncbi:hypothetical protein BHE90_004681 [Fusarium euwallaceae]|uniref:NACHT domain-containing protein n=2 Tax=Fusarium solani species complex TaxID=232080 RepID=A0A430LYK1_9HYPO|nr:hypothetical protein BHE90_004681 [Fusarium euwallaceae]